jgi:hypothetical protein
VQLAASVDLPPLEIVAGVAVGLQTGNTVDVGQRTTPWASNMTSLPQDCSSVAPVSTHRTTPPFSTVTLPEHEMEEPSAPLKSTAPCTGNSGTKHHGHLHDGVPRIIPLHGYIQ